jgi:cyclopropane fatty-acyl-phospholipid synthase-like methyltransferase
LFTLGGRSYPYYVHLHNRTWRNERIVEIPIAWAEIAARRGARILEIGNVVAHYHRYVHDTVDKYEPHAGVINADIVDFCPEKPYDLIVSISTLEHVGLDEDVRDPGKVLVAVDVIRRMLAPGGAAVVTVPLGYNPDLDAHLDAGRLRFDRAAYMKRINFENTWIEATWAAVHGSAYGWPFPSANALVVGWIEGPAR